MKLMQRCLFQLVCVFAMTGSALADQIPYGNFFGATVDYLNVTEDNNIPGNNSTQKFGPPQIISDTLDFDPVSFVASASSSGSGDLQTDLNDASLSMTIMGKGGNTIQNIIIREGGDYTLSSGGLGTLASVQAAVRFSVQEVNGVPVTPILGSGQLVFTPTGNGGAANGGSYVVPDDSGTAVLWDGFLDFDVTQLVAGATKVEVVLDNTLMVEANNGGTAFIKKKDFSGVAISVPEPATFLSILIGVGCLLRARRGK